MATFTFTARTSLGSWFAFTGPWKAELLNNGELCRVLRSQGWDWSLQIEKRIGWREFLQNSTLLQNWTKNMKFTFSNSSYPASEKDQVEPKQNPRFDKLTWSSNLIEATTGQVRLLPKVIKSAHPPFLLWKEWCPFQIIPKPSSSSRWPTVAT